MTHIAHIGLLILHWARELLHEPKYSLAFFNSYIFSTALTQTFNCRILRIKAIRLYIRHRKNSTSCNFNSRILLIHSAWTIATAASSAFRTFSPTASNQFLMYQLAWLFYCHPKTLSSQLYKKNFTQISSPWTHGLEKMSVHNPSPSLCADGSPLFWYWMWCDEMRDNDDSVEGCA